MKNFTGALLVGGKSRRMGRDKCVLEIAGEPLWRRQLGLLRALTETCFVVAPERPPWCPPEAGWIPDHSPGSGPLGGLAAALAHTRTEGLLLLAVDLPEMTADYLKSLQLRTAPNQGVAPEMDGLFQPLSAIYPRGVLAEAEAHLHSPDRSFQNLLRDLTYSGKMVALPVEAADRSLFRNLNTPSD